MTYIIGRVHGEYGSLLKLIKQLPKKSKLIFVGDLIDRGRKSKEVISFVRDNNHKCVLGNHEKMMIEYVRAFEKSYPSLPSMVYYHKWINSGGKKTLLSYDIIEIDKHDGKLLCTENKEKFTQLLEDVKWLESLPLYIKLDTKKNNKPIVISHASISEVWVLRDDEKQQSIFEEYALWNRKIPNEKTKIFNIFGHTIQKEVDISKHFINVDTGCCYANKGYGKLSAYCVESHSVMAV